MCCYPFNQIYRWGGLCGTAKVCRAIPWICKIGVPQGLPFMKEQSDAIDCMNLDISYDDLLAFVPEQVLPGVVCSPHPT